ncbi:MAG: T9SS type A sorting domain-containing protein [Bacteroidia bacterium]
MKKLIFTSLSTVFIMGASAQSPIVNSPGFAPAEKTPIVSPVHSSSHYGKTIVSNWYEPYVFASKAGASSTWQSYVNFLFPDSTVRYIDNNLNVTYMPGATNVGQVLDPKDDNIDLTDNPNIKMSNGNSYTLDSIYFRYLYVRNVDSIAVPLLGNVAVVDTLFIDYFIPSGIDNTGTINFSPPLVKEVYAKPAGFSIPNRRPTGMFTTQTILLTRNDSTIAAASTTTGAPESGWYSKYYFVKVPAVVSVNASSKNLVAFNLKFKPGHPYDSSSIMIYQSTNPLPAGSKRVNYFGYSTYDNGTGSPYPTQVTQTKFYNNTIVAEKRASYPNNPTGWQGYVPGNAYYAHQYFVNGFLLTTGNLEVNQITNDNFASTVYPNPAKVSQGAYVAFNLKNAAKVKVEIFNLMGQSVSLVADRMFDQGKDGVEVNLNGLSTGMYIVNVTVNGQTQSKKLSIVE